MARKPNGRFSVSHSEIEVYKKCKRRWFLQYYMRLKKKHHAPRIAADTGITVHSALHQYYTLGGKHNHEQAFEAAMEHLKQSRDYDIASIEDPAELKAMEEIHKVAGIITEGYFKWVEETGADDDWKVEGSEQRLEVDVEGTDVKGYVDLWGTHIPSGNFLVVDTKVVANIAEVLKTLHLNEQGPTYAVLMKMLDPDPNRGFRVVWNMIKRNKQTSRAKPPFYQRYELAINADQLAQFYMQLNGQIQDMITTEKRLNDGEAHYAVAYPSPSRDCSWQCPYLAVCGAMNDPRTDVEWIINNNYEQWGQESELPATVETTNE
jgi:hypothetical protein